MNRRHKDGDWALPTLADGRIESWQHVQIAVLMDLRDELKALNRLLSCGRFIAIPTKLDNINGTLQNIQANTRRRRKKRVVGKPKLRVVSRS